MKKLLLLTVIALLSFALLSCNDKVEEPSDATVAPESDFEYEENADGGITITSYKGDDKTVVIPEKIEGIAVTVIGEHAFEYNNVVETVSMPDTVTNIIHGAFFKAGSLKKVDFSDSLSEIGDGAFLGCNSLSEVSLPKGLKTIGNNAFSKCEALQSVTLPGSITEYGAETFSGSGLKFVEIENGVTEICSGMFSCTKIETVELPDSVEKIGAFAFAYCSELKTIKVGKSLKTVGSQAFVDTKNLKEIVFPASVELIDENAFAGFGPETVKFDGDAPDIIRSDIDIIERSKNLIVYYHKGAKGFGETWNGYPTRIRVNE